MLKASIVAGLQHVHCGNCQASLHDEFASQCPVCGATFDSITSRRPGLAAMLARRRRAEQIFFGPAGATVTNGIAQHAERPLH